MYDNGNWLSDLTVMDLGGGVGVTLYLCQGQWGPGSWGL